MSLHKPTPDQIASAEALFLALQEKVNAEFDTHPKAVDTQVYALDANFPALAGFMDRKHKVESWLYSATVHGETHHSFDHLLAEVSA